MKWKTFCHIKALATFSAGLLMLLIPSLFWSLFGVHESEQFMVLSRILGTLYVALGIIFFHMRELVASADRKRTAITVGSADLASAAILAVAASQVVLNPLTWVLVAVYGVFALAWFALG